jgi:hypothetical protein
MNALKYLVIPGPITLNSSGDFSWVGASELMKLYGVDPVECVIARPDVRTPAHMSYLVPLRPRADGNYNLTRGVVPA